MRVFPNNLRSVFFRLTLQLSLPIMQPKPLRMDSVFLRHACDQLAARDPALDSILRQCGYPPLWDREPGFSTLVHIILEQQVSLASANATWARLLTLLNGRVTPSHILQLPEERFREIGFSMQKMRFAKSIASEVHSGKFCFESLDLLSDDDVKTQLKRLHGIGDWSADIYLSECLLRPDILPKGDIAILEVTRQIRGLDRRPDHETLLQLTDLWRPFRSVATRVLWQRYLHR